MRPRLVLWSLVAAVGAAVAGVAGFFVVRGPFLGGPVLAPVPLMVATGGFVAGVIALALGGTKVARLVARRR
ncbi:MAG: hypothetical protein ABEJ34_02465 [Haloferacaceae archaeon]